MREAVDGIAPFVCLAFLSGDLNDLLDCWIFNVSRLKEVDYARRCNLSIWLEPKEFCPLEV